MKLVRVTVGLVGAAAFGLALGAIVDPSLTGQLDPTTVVPNDYLVVVPLGAAAVLVVLGTVAGRSVRGVDQATPPDPEGVPTADAPGATFDRLIGGGLTAAPTAYRRRAELRDRLREAATRTVMRTERCARPAARQRVGDGSWTDDAAAATFLADGPVTPTPTVAVAALLGGELPLQRRARRTAAAIDRLQGGGS